MYSSMVFYKLERPHVKIRQHFVANRLVNMACSVLLVDQRTRQFRAKTMLKLSPDPISSPIVITCLSSSNRSHSHLVVASPCWEWNPFRLCENNRSRSVSSLRLSALMVLYIHPLYVLVSKILSSILNSPTPIHPLYHPLSTLSTVGSTYHFI
jgi:hypothetical protein